MEKIPWVERALEKSSSTAGGKVTTLAEAIAAFVRPGQSLQVGSGTGYPMALLYEIIRQFWGRCPGFTFISYGGGSTNLVPFVQGNLVQSVVSTFMGDPYPFPSPNPFIQKAFAEGKIRFEEWSMLSLTQRLVAGAMGLPFFPTRSLAGSSLAQDLPGFTLIADPFSGEEVGLVEALNPDLSLVSGWMADPDGNTVLNMPLVGNVYGPLAAREGAIVTVERVVSPAELSRYSEHVRLPAQVVRAVVEEPFGAHPSGHHHFPHRGGEWGYAEDREFILEARKACRSEERYREWINYWILDCPDHRTYLRKLGARRLTGLKGQLSDAIMSPRLVRDRTGEAASKEPTPAEAMIVTAAREIDRMVAEREHSSILAGVGASHLASWLAYYSLLERGLRVPLLAEIGLYGYVPLPGDPFVFALRNFPTSDYYSDVLHILGCFVGGSFGRCLGVLGAGQVDKEGNINSSQIPGAALYLVGSGGGNDVASGSDEVVVVVEQGPHRFVEKVPYVTSPGKRVSTVVSQLGIFHKDPGDGMLKLAAYMDYSGKSREDNVRAIKEQCGWDLQLKRELQRIEPPSAAELDRLRCFDPERYFLQGWD